MFNVPAGYEAMLDYYGVKYGLDRIRFRHRDAIIERYIPRSLTCVNVGRISSGRLADRIVNSDDKLIYIWALTYSGN